MNTVSVQSCSLVPAKESGQHAKLIKRSSQQVRPEVETHDHFTAQFASHQTGIKGGDALVDYKNLRWADLIYEQLKGKLMICLLADDITADKDF